MSSRDALRAFQSHLTNRLQEARTSGVDGSSWLAVQAAGRRWLLPLSHAGEIFPWVAPQPVPYTQPWFSGVANLRGSLCGVIDLGAFLGAGQQSQRSEASIAQSRLVALNPVLGVNCALLVDRLLGLRNIGSFAESSEPSADAPDYFGHGYTDADAAHWQELNLQALSQNPLFLSISA